MVENHTKCLILNCSNKIARKWLDGVSEDTVAHHLKGTRAKLKLLKLFCRLHERKLSENYFFLLLITYSMGAASKIINRFRDLCVKTGNEK